jgi:glycosyltransferase involved in cell wall biosynthesis
MESRSALKVPVTVVVPTLNEAKNLPRCLDHLRWADEVVLIDSSSTDDTCKIAAAYGARVINFKWNGQWPKKRGWMLDHADLKYSWVLMVDADEWIVPALADEIAAAIKSDRNVGYWINRKFVFMGRFINHCGYYPSWNLRLVKRGHAKFERLTEVGDTGSGDNEVHEHLIADGPVERLKHDMLHLAYPTIASFMEKHNRYSSWEAAVQFKSSGQKSGAAIVDPSLRRKRFIKHVAQKMPMRPLLRFVYHYVYRLGFLDGRAGLTLCKLLAIYEWLSVAKYREIRQAERDREIERHMSTVPEFDWKAHQPV